LATRRLSLPETIFIEFARRICAVLPGALPPPELRPPKPDSDNFTDEALALIGATPLWSLPDPFSGSGNGGAAHGLLEGRLDGVGQL